MKHLSIIFACYEHWSFDFPFLVRLFPCRWRSTLRQLASQIYGRIERCWAHITTVEQTYPSIPSHPLSPQKFWKNDDMDFSSDGSIADETGTDNDNTITTYTCTQRTITTNDVTTHTHTYTHTHIRKQVQGKP